MRCKPKRGVFEENGGNQKGLDVCYCLWGSHLGWCVREERAPRSAVHSSKSSFSKGREKKTIKKNHIKEFGGRMPRRRLRDKLGTSQGHLGHLGLIFVCKSMLKGQNVPGTDGTYHGTDRTCPRDRRDAHQGVSRQNSLCLLVFFLSPIFVAFVNLRPKSCKNKRT